MINLHLTPTERRLYEAMADGEGHPPRELLELLDDELSGKEVLKKHICLLRSKLKEVGEDIVAQNLGKYTVYRRVRLLRIVRQGE